jgi:hypothetical protein
LDVTLLVIVVVHFDMSRNLTSVGHVNGPSADPLSTPEGLEVQIVARYLNNKLRAIPWSINSKLGCSLLVKQLEITMHGFNDLIAQLNSVWLQILCFPIDIFFFNFAFKCDGVEWEFNLSGGIIVNKFFNVLNLLDLFGVLLFFNRLLLFLLLLCTVLIIFTIKECCLFLSNRLLLGCARLLILHERLLSAHDCNETGSTVREVHMKTVSLKVVSQAVLDLRGREEFWISTKDFGDVVDDFMEFAHWRALDEIFANLDSCHFY